MPCWKRRRAASDVLRMAHIKAWVAGTAACSAARSMKLTILSETASFRKAYPGLAFHGLSGIASCNLFVAFSDFPAIGFRKPSPLIKGETLRIRPRWQAISLITGFASRPVYDTTPWISAPLMGFARAAAAAAVAAGRQSVSGHQLLAEKALGGQGDANPPRAGAFRASHLLSAGLSRPCRRKCPKTVLCPRSAIQDPGCHFPPPGADVIARSDFTPYAGLNYGEWSRYQFPVAIPSFDDTIRSALYLQARADRLGRPPRKAGRRSAVPSDSALVGKMDPPAFLKSHAQLKDWAVNIIRLLARKTCILLYQEGGRQTCVEHLLKPGDSPP